MKSIKIKLIVNFSILILVICISLGALLLKNASTSIVTESEQGLEALVNEGARLTESRMDSQFRYLEGLANIEKINNPELNLDTKMEILLEKAAESDYLRIGVADLEGNLYLSDSYGINKQIVDILEREYYQKSLEGKRQVMPPALSVNPDDNGAMIMVTSVPLYFEKEIVGVLVAVGKPDFLNGIVDDLKYGEQGYSYIINGSGTVIAHPKREMVTEQFNPIEGVKEDSELQSIANLFGTILVEKQGIGEYQFNGNNLYAGYAPIEGTDWSLVITANESEVLSAIPALQKSVIIFTLVIVVISIIIAYFVGASITNPIIQVIKHSEKMAKLDLTSNVSDSLLKKKDEVGSLSHALQTITNNLRAIISEINQSAEQVSASSEELTATSHQSAIAAEEVSKSIVEIASGALDQSHNTEEGTSKAVLMGEIVEKDQAYVKDLNHASEKVNQVVSEGLTEIENLTRISAESSSATKEVHAGIIKTNDSATKIGEASKVIATIAEQTNLLALNAAIEAARAGEAGKGFSVVADEIRKLAEQSTNSTKTIDEVVRELQTNSKAAVEIMERVTSILLEQENSVRQSKEKYVSIDNAMTEAEQAVEKLNISSHEMEQMKDAIINTMQNLSAIAEENSASTEEISATMQEQAASMDDISRSSESLSKLAQNLQAIITKFKV